LVPPADEQDRIAQYLEAKLAQFDNAESTVTHSIRILQEYRTALISAAVTGKIDVRLEDKTRAQHGQPNSCGQDG